MAAQDQALQTKYYATKILNTGTYSKCRLCQQFDETTDHTVSACPILAKEQYIKRHDRVSAQLHFNICKETGIKLDKKHWYEQVPKSVETSQGGKVTTLWNQQVQTDRTTLDNKPDIIIHDNEKGTCMLIDVAISGDRTVTKNEAEKILKYKDLTIEKQHMWNVTTKVIPVIIWATGTISDLTIEKQRMWNVTTKVIPVIIWATRTISKSFRAYVSNIPGKHEVKELQKTAILGTAHILRKVLM